MINYLLNNQIILFAIDLLVIILTSIPAAIWASDNKWILFSFIGIPICFLGWVCFVSIAFWGASGGNDVWNTWKFFFRMKGY